MERIKGVIQVGYGGDGPNVEEGWIDMKTKLIQQKFPINLTCPYLIRPLLSFVCLIG